MWSIGMSDRIRGASTGGVAQERGEREDAAMGHDGALRVPPVVPDV